MAVLLALPAQASTPATGAVGAEFAASVEAFEEIPLPPPPSAEAVDPDTLEPPVDAEPTTRSLGTGIASYYASKFHGRRTASGELFDNGALTAAHRTLPFGTLVRVTNPRTGQSVIVRINDRGPFTKGRTIDLSRAAAEEIGIVRAGHGTVELELIEA